MVWGLYWQIKNDEIGSNQKELVLEEIVMFFVILYFIVVYFYKFAI